jgi:hypothetical protein
VPHLRAAREALRLSGVAPCAGGGWHRARPARGEGSWRQDGHHGGGRAAGERRSDALKELAGELKRRCGTGGSAKEGVIESQGDHRDVLVTELEARGYTVKRAGG